MTKEETYSLKYFSRAGLVILILFTILLSFAYYTREPEVITIQDPNYIPSQREIQQRLEDLGNPRYDPNGVDGWIGKDSRTAWDNYTKDQHAKRAVEGE